MWEQWVGLGMLGGIAFALILWVVWEHGYSRGQAYGARVERRHANQVAREMIRQLDRRTRGVW